MKGYPRWFVPALVGTLLMMFVTGLLLTPTTLALRVELSVPWRLPSAGRIAVAALHAAGSFVSMLVVGALWSVHMRSGWRRRQRRTSGVLLGCLLMLLAASAVAVYYLGEESLGSVAALLHLGAGLVLSISFAWHWLPGRRARKRERSHGDGPAQTPLRVLR